MPSIVVHIFLYCSKFVITDKRLQDGKQNSGTIPDTKIVLYYVPRSPGD